MTILETIINIFNNKALLGTMQLYYQENTWITFSLGLFLVGSCGVFLSRRNIIILIMSIEIMLLAINLNFICFAILLDDILAKCFLYSY
jgi:NADH:ubiquinone oxidoreductase subunit K